MNVRLHLVHLLRFLAPLPERIGDNCDPHSGQAFKSCKFCLTLIITFGELVTTILVVVVGRSLGAGAGLVVGVGLAARCAAAFCIDLEAPPHPPHPIMLWPF